ncbi:MAG: leucine-rich repeat domain-containing protein [Bacteroidaceae bacterium]|nr:leucine-rich repeat domain-containing protein [Bacteroidaceae bacterium]
MKKTLLLNLFLAMFFGAQTAQASVVLNATNFPDATFRTYISELTGVSIGGTISDAKLANVEKIAVKEMGISSLKGIEYFTEITYLWCQENRLTSLDVSKNTKLTYLQCNNNQITSLDVSKNTEMIDLFCYGNLITSLDVSKNTKLEVLNCYSNQLISLDVSKNTMLFRLVCADNQLTSLNITNNTKLTSLECARNQITSLNVSNNTKLINLYCDENKISSLFLGNNTELKSFACSANKIDQLDLSNNTKLCDLWCDDNYLTNLNLGNNTSLDKDYIRINSQSSTRRFETINYGSNTNNCWTLYVGTTDASRIRNLKIDGESKTPVTNASGWLVVSDDLKKIPQKIEYEIYTGNAAAGWMSVTVNYDVKKYGVYVDGKELTSLNFYDIPGLKEGTAYFYDESSDLGWDGTQPTLVLSDAKIEGEDGIRNEDCYNLNIIVRGDNEVTATDFNAFSSNSVAVKTTFSGGGTLRFTATSDTWNGIYAIDSYIIIKDATKIIARGNGYGYFDDGSILYIQENAILACYGDVYSVEPPSEKNRKFDTNIGIRYPAGAFFSGYHVYYAGTSTDVQKDWVVIGPDNQATQNVIADGIASPKSSPDGTDLIYNMAGQRVGNGYKGIVIKDGRKTLRK